MDYKSHNLSHRISGMEDTGAQVRTEMSALFPIRSVQQREEEIKS